ncbi:MAG: succinate-semialdehyde dehydrogenase / glutarate-semialdehyde dehydrogenase [Candidatus Eremiobacteraeota bacterium]|jgi:succinate-semialdehyde dehydrogenase/glutarate-semialdehyde dehydrogenase|nr:succinate-semialdehyde dehydrogenase / glutarate-semialdehyde dehydrogenase [Candidatus Eremiobacteraeota bacterium]
MSSTAERAASIETRNPATDEAIARYEPYDKAAVGARLDAAVAAQRRWRELSFAERGKHAHAAARYLRERKGELAELATREMGKPIAEAEAEVEKCAVSCDWFADNAERLLANEDHPSSAARSYVAFRPLVVLLAIMPWNFPYWQAFRAAAPALMAGNAVVLKHAANVTGVALKIEEIFRASGLPEGTFATLLVGSKEMEPIVLDDRIAAVTLTGSEAAGSSVGASAGKAIKKTVLELGGSDYFIVLADADLEKAAETGVKARFQNTGQSCIAAKRFIIEDAVYDRYVELFVEKARALKSGDPMDRETKIGPMARTDLRDDLAKQVRDTVAAGAKLLLGGEPPAGPGAYYPPTVVGDVQPGMRMAEEETFGPAAALMRARDAAHAVELANESRYGLGGNLWTRDIAKAERLAARLESGNCFINGMTASDPRLPFGGVKKSGIGRELSEYGIREFVNVQTVWIGPDTGASPGGRPAE